jgi:hypothetical protein
MSLSQLTSNASPEERPFAVAAELLSQTAEISQIISQYHCTCRNECVINSISSLLSSSPHNMIQNLKKFIKSIKISFNKTGQYQDENSSIDPIDVFSTVLVNFHCFQTIKSCLQDEDSPNQDCKGQCILHKFFHLGVKETYICQCGSSTENEWDSTNVCQFFNVSGILEDLDKEKTTKLAVIPRKLLERSREGNAFEYLERINKKLRERLENASAETCQNDDCEYKNSRVRFEVTNAPKFYILDVIWDEESTSIGFIESFLASVSVSMSFELKDIYMNGKTKIYKIHSIVFARGNNFKIAYFDEGGFNVEGMRKGAYWDELLCEITLLRLHPVAVVYEEGRKVQSGLGRKKLMKLEQVAAQCEFSEEPFFDDKEKSTGLFLEEKKKTIDRRPDLSSVIQPINEGIQKRPQEKLPAPDRNFNPRQEEKNYGGYGYSNKTDTSSVNQLINPGLERRPQEKKPSPDINFNLLHEENKYVTPGHSTQLQRNEKLAEKEVQKEKMKVNDDQDYFEKRDVQQFYDFDPAEGYFDRKDNVVTNNGVEVKNFGKKEYGSWECNTCGKKNDNTFEKCISCQSPKGENYTPGWICGACYNRNISETSFKCARCNEIDKQRYEALAPKVVKPARKFADAEPKIEKNDKIPPREEIRINIWECMKCKTSNMPDYDICTKCDNLKPGVTGWVCKSCKVLNKENNYRCTTCGNYKDSKLVVNQEFWLCEKCKTAIIEGIDFCEKCGFDKSPPKRKTHELAVENSKYINCPSCYQRTSTYSGRCLYCKAALIKQNRNKEEKKQIRVNEWTCNICKTNNSNDDAICSGCYNQITDRKVDAANQIKYIEKNKEDEINRREPWKCSTCNNKNLSTSTICRVCRNQKIEEFKPKQLALYEYEKKNCKYCKKYTDSLTGICKDCVMMHKTPESPGEKQDRIVNSRDAQEWVCKRCNILMSNEARRCSICKQFKSVVMKPETGLGRNSQTKKCRLCKKDILMVVCECRNQELATTTKCKSCKRDISDINVCSNCSEKTRLAYYGNKGRSGYN